MRARSRSSTLYSCIETSTTMRSSANKTSSGGLPAFACTLLLTLRRLRRFCCSGRWNWLRSTPMLEEDLIVDIASASASCKRKQWTCTHRSGLNLLRPRESNGLERDRTRFLDSTDRTLNRTSGACRKTYNSHHPLLEHKVEFGYEAWRWNPLLPRHRIAPAPLPTLSLPDSRTEVHPDLA